MFGRSPPVVSQQYIRLAIFRTAGEEFGAARCLTGLGAVASARRQALGASALEREREAGAGMECEAALRAAREELGSA